MIVVAVTNRGETHSEHQWSSTWLDLPHYRFLCTIWFVLSVMQKQSQNRYWVSVSYEGESQSDQPLLENDSSRKRYYSMVMEWWIMWRRLSLCTDAVVVSNKTQFLFCSLGICQFVTIRYSVRLLVSLRLSCYPQVDNESFGMTTFSDRVRLDLHDRVCLPIK